MVKKFDYRTGMYIEEEPPADHAYVQFRANPANDAVTDGQWCVQVGWTLDDLAYWKTENPSEMEKILRTRRSRYADEMIKIDAALLKKAKDGDHKSIQLAWARFENWSPRIEEEQSKKTGGRSKTLAEMIEEGEI